MGTPVRYMKVHFDVFGVESLNMHEIQGEINFETKTSTFKKIIDYPLAQDSIYQLDTTKIKQLERLINNLDLEKLKTHYTLDNIPDQPKSTLTIQTAEKEYTIADYGLSGTPELMKIYTIVYGY